MYGSRHNGSTGCVPSLHLASTGEASASSILADCAIITLRDPKHCVMIYMHGNAGNRILGHRKHLARHVSSGNLDMNMVIFDYR